MIRSDLTAYLKSRGDLTSLVGQRIHWIRIPQREKGETTFPCVTFRRATGGHYQNLDGSQGYAQPLFEFDVWGPDSVSVERVAEQLRLSLQGFRGAIGSTRVSEITLDDEQDFYHPDETGGDAGIYRVQFKYTIGHAEAIPAFV